MKKVFFACIVTLLVISCSQEEKKDDGASVGTQTNPFYEKNLSALKSLYAAFEKKDVEGEAAYIADSALWSSAVYGDTIQTKQHWLESNKYVMDNFNNVHFIDANFLPGIDSTTHELDGSVRVYGNWTGIHSSGKEVLVKFYGTYDFNKDNKVTSGSEYYDQGGMMNAIQAAGK